MKILSVVGARPNFMKIAPFIRTIQEHNQNHYSAIEHILVHTGQHYDDKMSRAFFEALNIPEADINLGVGSGTHAEQVGQTMIAFEKVVRSEKPDWVVVVGDVNATLACSVTAKKEWVKCCHIEAGLRSGDMTMPEEINRLVTDRLCDLLLTPDELSSENLRKEGVSEERIKFVGNIMIDTLEAQRHKAEQLSIEQIIQDNLYRDQRSEVRGQKTEGRDAEENAGPSEIRCADTSYISRGENPGILEYWNKKEHKPSSSKLPNFSTSQLPSAYGVMTMHRPSNVDEPSVFKALIDFLCDEVCRDMPLVWPIHPRAENNLKKFGLWERVTGTEGLVLLSPVGYHEMLRLNMGARVMLTDSGGLQEECCVLGTPCLTLRWNTERPVTLKEHGGASVLVGNEIRKIRAAYTQTLKEERSPMRPRLWDGKTAERCLAAILNAS
jgi:UDP-N-acetylglucosamine 2-epimerase (non-hydrolysing)